MSSDAATRIRHELARRRWTQAQLAQHAQVSLTTVSRIVGGRDYSNPRSLARIEAALGIGEYATDPGPRSWAEVLDSAPATELAAAVVRRLGAAQQILDHPVDRVPAEVFTEPGTLFPHGEDAPTAADG